MHPRLIHTLVLLDPAIQPHSTKFDGGTLLETGKQTMTKSTQFSTHVETSGPLVRALTNRSKRAQPIKHGIREYSTAGSDMVSATSPPAFIQKLNQAPIRNLSL